MSARWEKHVVQDNKGKPLEVLRLGEYELVENVNLGLEGGWVFELTLSGRRVGLYSTVSEGKEGAAL